MSEQGWKRLTAGAPWFAAGGNYPIAAYSEFMPPPRLGEKPYGDGDEGLFDAADPWGWRITEYEEALELQPGLLQIASQLLHALRHLARGEPAHGIAAGKLRDNPFWPAELHAAGAPPQERCTLLLPLALSRTQDDKGRVRWTLFGASEDGPGRAFWRGFFVAPRRELPAEWAIGFLRRLLAAAYQEPLGRLGDLRRAGLRIYSSPDYALLPQWDEGPLPRWSEPYRWQPGQSLRGVRWLLTFCPLTRLPAAVRRGVLGGRVALAAVSGQPAVLRRAGVLENGKGIAPGRANSPAALAPAARGPVGNSHSAVRLDARGSPGRSSASRFRPDPRRASAERTAGRASIVIMTNSPKSPPARTSSPTSFSAPPPPTSDSMANRWPAIRKSGRKTSACSWTVRGLGPPN